MNGPQVDTLQPHDFVDFFAALHGGNKPFAWQQRLLAAVLDGGGWPSTVAAPTGAGKTAVIDVHVFALAMAVSNDMPLPPRRLAMIVDRRVLVDDQYRHAQRIADRLAAPGDSPILAAVAEFLSRLQGTSESTGSKGSPLLVARLRGGVPSSRRWVDHPTAAAVLCATPDMWGSRLLFRGYGSSSRAWPREAGLLALDTVAVVDEAHLAQQLVHTARRVRELVSVTDRPWDGPPVLQVVATTATPNSRSDGVIVTVKQDDLAEPTLGNRLCRPKPVTLVPNRDWPTNKRAVEDELARVTVGLLDVAGGGGRTVGCFVNTVARAIAVATALRDVRTVGRKLTVVMLCGQVRPIDVDLLEVRFPGLLGSTGNANVDIVVSTQTLEVGVDLDFGGIVTELASGSALAQRAGRVNRLGKADNGPIHVMVPDGAIRADTRSGPYGPDELAAAREWIDRRAADSQGLAPWALRDDPPPVAGLRRELLQRPELGQVWHLARTSDDVANHDLDLWLSDDLPTNDATVGIIVRRGLSADINEACRQVALVRPRDYEIFAVPLRAARTALIAALRTLRDAKSDAQLNAVLIRSGETSALEWTTSDDEYSPTIKPGDLVVLDAATPLVTVSNSDREWTPPVIGASDDRPLFPADDVLEAIAELHEDLAAGDIVHRIELRDVDQRDGTTPADQLADAIAAVPDDIDTEPPVDTQPAELREIVRTWLDAHADPSMGQAAAQLLLDSANDREVDVVVDRDADNVPIRVTVVDRRRAQADEYVRQEWTPSRTRVTLDNHQRDVAERVATLATQLNLDGELRQVLREAALHHDDGKHDPRFQVRLGNRPGASPLAKSHGLATPETVRRRRDRSGLPGSWRHEQRSVVDAWSAVPSTLDCDLVARLIGTTHGHGRTDFPHTSRDLLHPDDGTDMRAIAAMLFDEGGWDELIEHTHLRYGVWQCAYLEAVLRAADGQTSAAGR